MLEVTLAHTDLKGLLCLPRRWRTHRNRRRRQGRGVEEASTGEEAEEHSGFEDLDSGVELQTVLDSEANVPLMNGDQLATWPIWWVRTFPPTVPSDISGSHHHHYNSLAASGLNKARFPFSAVLKSGGLECFWAGFYFHLAFIGTPHRGKIYKTRRVSNFFWVYMKTSYLHAKKDLI